ncbi:MAG: NAD-dependent epimerase/dehydratase family protein [Candidatus Latescibacteria bacterium]|nr:NAD-dependent epimerase/dehydratase family protein [Candidatus Latescibacterota bacterium]
MSLRNQPVLVAGATGFVGSNLITRLLSEEATIRATIHRRPPVVVDDRIEYIHADLTKGEDCRRAVEGQRLVFLCAASTSGAATIATTPMVHVTPNVLMNTQLLEAAYEAGVEKLLWLSSTTGYPLSGNRPVREEEMFEGEPYEKYFFVGWMKRFTEILCRMYGEKLPKTMTTIVLRPTNIYGPNDDFEPATSHVTAALIRKVVERQNPIEVWGTGEDVRDVIYVDDLVEAMVRAVEKVESYTAINIGLGKAYTVKHILQMIMELDDYTDVRIVFNASKPTMIPIRLVDTTKAETVLGFRAKTDLREGLQKTIGWYSESRNISTT